MKAGVTCTIQYTFSDCMNALAFGWPKVMGVTVVVLLILFVFTPASLLLWFAGFLVVLALMFFGVIRLFSFFPVHLTPPRPFEKYGITLSAEGVVVEARRSNLRFQWVEFSRAVENAHAYLLCLQRGIFLLIPKRVLHSEAGDLQMIGDLLTAHIGGVLRVSKHPRDHFPS